MTVATHKQRNHEAEVLKDINSEQLNRDCKSTQEELADHLVHHVYEKSFAPGKRHSFEAEDRIKVVTSYIQDFLLYHPSIAQKPVLWRLIRIGLIFIEKAYSLLEEENKKRSL